MQDNKRLLLLLAGAALLISAKGIGNKFVPPVPGKVTSRFGWRTDPVKGGQQFHNGVDLKANYAPVLAVAAGKVVSVYTDNELGGLQIRIKHANGYSSGYAHLSKSLVKRGDMVQKGSVIAISGNTGKSTAPHLHFTLTNPAGNKVDPELFIKFHK